jgi:arylsulfatase A-like enzyme
LNTLLGKSKTGREWLVEHASNGRLSLIKGDWKTIEPGPGVKVNVNTNTETGNDTVPQLYNLRTDIGERNNLASEHPVVLKELSDLLKEIKDNEINRLKN